MENEASDRFEDPPSGDSGPGGARSEIEARQSESSGIDPALAMQFAEIAEDHGRERSKAAVSRGLAGPVALCSAAMGCGLLGGIYLIGAAFMYGTSVVWLVRMWNLVPRSSLLSDVEKRKWMTRLKLTAAYAALAGVVLAGLTIAFAASFWRTASAIAAQADAARDSQPSQMANMLPRRSKDDSLAPDAYVDLGMSAHDRAWSGPDMARAANVLAKVVEKNTAQLPRFESPRSGQMFARIVAHENLELFRNASLPLAQRIGIAAEFLQSSNAILKIYLASYNRGATGTAELTELIGVQLRMFVIMGQLIDAFVPTLDKNAADYDVRMKGLEKFRAGMAMGVAGASQTLTERKAYSTPDLKRLLGYMRETYSEILPRLTPASRTEAIVRLRSLGNEPTMADLNPELSALVDQVEPLFDGAEN